MSSACTSRVIIAEGAIGQLNTVLQGYKRPLVISDVMIYDKYGELVESLLDADIIWSISPEHRKGVITQYPGVDVVVGFGGGKSIDLAKLSADEAGLDWISIPTAASHDGIASDGPTGAGRRPGARRRRRPIGEDRRRGSQAVRGLGNIVVLVGPARRRLAR